MSCHRFTMPSNINGQTAMWSLPPSGPPSPAPSAGVHRRGGDQCGEINVHAADITSCDTDAGGMGYRVSGAKEHTAIERPAFAVVRNIPGKDHAQCSRRFNAGERGMSFPKGGKYFPTIRGYTDGERLMATATSRQRLLLPCVAHWGRSSLGSRRLRPGQGSTRRR